jgi:hypothetical protein
MVLDWECARCDEDAEYGVGTCGIGHAPKEAIHFRHYDDGLVLFGSCQEVASRRAGGERLAATDSRILEHLDETESLHLAVGGNALALRFEAKATLSLFFAGHSDVADGVSHRVFDKHFTP